MKTLMFLMLVAGVFMLAWLLLRALYAMLGVR